MLAQGSGFPRAAAKGVCCAAGLPLKSPSTPPAGLPVLPTAPDTAPAMETTCSPPASLRSTQQSYSEYEPPELSLDIPCLLSLASAALHAPCVRVEKLTRGTNHEIFLLRFEPPSTQCGATCIARFSREHDEHHAKVDAAELHTLRFLKAHTSLPVPTIFLARLDLKNGTGAPFLLMERLPGRALYKIWPEMSMVQKICAVEQVAAVVSQLGAFEFGTIGSLEASDSDDSDSGSDSNYSEDKSDDDGDNKNDDGKDDGNKHSNGNDDSSQGGDNNNGDSDESDDSKDGDNKDSSKENEDKSGEDSDNKDSNSEDNDSDSDESDDSSNGARIGHLVHSGISYDPTTRMGPFPSTLAYFTFFLQHAHSLVTPSGHDTVDALQTHLTEYLASRPKGGSLRAPYGLLHTDLDSQNLLFVFPSSEADTREPLPVLTGVLDWEYAATAPRFFIYDFPLFLQDSDYEPETWAENVILRREFIRHLLKISQTPDVVRDSFANKNYLLNWFENTFKCLKMYTSESSKSVFDKALEDYLENVLNGKGQAYDRKKVYTPHELGLDLVQEEVQEVQEKNVEEVRKNKRKFSRFLCCIII